MTKIGSKGLKLFGAFSKMGGAAGQVHSDLAKLVTWGGRREDLAGPKRGWQDHGFQGGRLRRRLGWLKAFWLVAFQGHCFLGRLPKWLSDYYCRQFGVVEMFLQKSPHYSGVIFAKLGLFEPESPVWGYFCAYAQFYYLHNSLLVEFWDTPKTGYLGQKWPKKGSFLGKGVRVSGVFGFWSRERDAPFLGKNLFRFLPKNG